MSKMPKRPTDKEIQSLANLHRSERRRKREDRETVLIALAQHIEKGKPGRFAAIESARDAVIDAARKLGPWLKGSSLEREFPTLCQRLRAALSALSALETPNDTKE